MRIAASSTFLLCGFAALALAGCAKRGDISSTGDGIIQFRQACPIVAIPAHTGDLTVFNPSDSRTAESVDMTASISNLQSRCDTVGGQLVSRAQFLVVGLRRDPGPAREVNIPYFSVVMRGSTEVVAKRIGVIRLQFQAGQLRAGAWGQTSSSVDKAAATLPPEIERLIVRPRRSGDPDAANDPLAQPQVKEAIQKASYELLVGFNLTQDQLRYNITR